MTKEEIYKRLVVYNNKNKEHPSYIIRIICVDQMSTSTKLNSNDVVEIEVLGGKKTTISTSFLIKDIIISSVWCKNISKLKNWSGIKDIMFIGG